MFLLSTEYLSSFTFVIDPSSILREAYTQRCEKSEKSDLVSYCEYYMYVYVLRDIHQKFGIILLSISFWIANNSWKLIVHFASF